MLPVGIGIGIGIGIGVMVASVVLGVIAFALVAFTSSTVRSAGRSTRTAMGLSAREEDAFAEDPSGEGAYDPAATDLHHSVEDEQPYYPREPTPPLAAEVADAPRWVLGMAILSGGGLVLGLLLVMLGDHVTARKRP